MIILHRIIGKWLDKNYYGDKEEIMARASNIMSSPIAAAMVKSDLYYALERAVQTGSYAYAVPHTIKVFEMKNAQFYRYEAIDSTRYIGDSSVLYGRGEVLKDYYRQMDEPNVLFGNTRVLVYSYPDFNAMLKDMSEECYVMDSGTNLVLTNANLVYAKWVDGLFLRESHIKDIYVPISEKDC